MEEILASIRRIISEDDEGDGDEQPAGASAARDEGQTGPKFSITAEEAMSEATPHRPAGGDPAAEVAEAVARIEPAGEDERPTFVETVETPPEDIADITQEEPAMSAQTAEKTSATEDAPGQEVSDLVDDISAGAAAEAFKSLSQSVRVSKKDGPSLEDIVVEMLRPMIKDWLDRNLPAIVEEKVQEEVQRISRRAR